MMETSEQIDKLAAALAKAQGELEGAAKRSNNPAYRSKYADLGAVWDAWQEVGPKNGLAVVQAPIVSVDAKMVSLVTTLMHASGQWMRATFAIPAGKQDAHGYGSAVTYLRRFALSAIVGVCPVDDDGNAAVGLKDKPSPAQLNPAKDEPGGDDDRRAKWAAWVEEHKAKLRGFEAASDADGLRAWKAKFDSALNRLRAADSALYDDLFLTFDDVATALRPNTLAGG